MNPNRSDLLRLCAVLACLAMILVACGSSPGDSGATPTPNLTQVYETVNAQLTQVVLLTPSSTMQPAPTESGLPTPTVSLQPSPTMTRTPASLPTTIGSCDLAVAGNPIDITIPDDTKVQPGQAFTKIWRLQNAGNCTWSNAYSVGLFSGEAMTPQVTASLPRQVAPGESVDIAIDMVAPQSPGTYQGNWKLKNAQGGWFGIGPNGGSPFWVRIVVEPLPTATVTPPVPSATPTATSTPAVLANGSVTLKPMQKFDLDQSATGGGEDISYETNADGQHLLIPQGNVVAAVMSTNQPTWGNCQTANMSAQPLMVENIPVGSYLCYRTNQGMLGWLKLTSFNASDEALLIDYLTWK